MDEKAREQMDEFSKRLKALRLERDLSLDMVVYDLEQKFNISITKSHLSRWENNKNIPSLRYGACLANYYGVSLDYLIGNTDVRTPGYLMNMKKEGKNGKSD